MNKAIFLGTFNPPHSGHINCLKSVIQSGLLNDLWIDKIHIIPCWQNPNKESVENPIQHYWQRHRMCTLEFAGLKEFCAVNGIEFKLQPKYTYELIDYFNSDKDDAIKPGFWWIITYETFMELVENKWMNAGQLLNENNFIVLVKDIQEKEALEKHIEFTFNRFFRCMLLNESYTDLHSTQLRNMLIHHDNVYPYINEDTQNYINTNNIYGSIENR